MGETAVAKEHPRDAPERRGHCLLYPCGPCWLGLVYAEERVVVEKEQTLPWCDRLSLRRLIAAQNAGEEPRARPQGRRLLL